MVHWTFSRTVRPPPKRISYKFSRATELHGCVGGHEVVEDELASVTGRCQQCPIIAEGDAVDDIAVHIKATSQCLAFQIPQAHNSPRAS